MIHDKAYQDWKNHKCNENQIERMDNLNKKYMDDSSSANTSKESPFLSNDTYEDVNADSELNAGVHRDLNNFTDEIVDVENPLVNDTSSMSNVAEPANANSNNSLYESSSLNNADPTTNSQHESQSTLLAANLTPPTATQAAPIVQSNTRGVYNCTPSTTSTQGRTVTPGEQKSNPYKCDYCSKSYQSKYSLKRHQDINHVTPKVKIPATTTTTTYNKPKLNMPPLMAIDGLPPNVNALPLDSSDDNVNQNQTKFDFKKPPIKKNIKTNFYKPQPQSSIVTRNGGRRSKRNFEAVVEDDDDDDDEVPPPKSIKTTYRRTHRGGGNFYSSWD